MTVSGGNLPDLENNFPFPEISELGAPAAEIQPFSPQFVSPPLPDIFCGAIGAQLQPDIPKLLPCIKETDFLHPCSLHEEDLGEKGTVMVGEMLDMFDRLDLCGGTLLSFGELDPPVDNFCVLDADSGEFTGTFGNSCSSVTTNISLEHNPPLFDQGSPLGLSDTICELHKDPKLWALEEMPMAFHPHSPLSPSPCEGTTTQSPGLDGESVMSQPTSRGSSMPVRSLVAWVTSTDQES